MSAPVNIVDESSRIVMSEPIRDEQNRIVAPPQTIYAPRPLGPWTNNTRTQ